MQKLAFRGLTGLACLALAVAPLSAKALVIAPAPIPQRVAGADAVVVGKVQAIEEKTVTATAPYPGAKDKVEYQVAIVKVEEGLAGAKGLTHVKVGFQVPQNPVGGGDGGIRPPIRRPALPSLAKDQEVCLFLTKHPEEGFYVMPNYFDLIDKKGPNFEKEVAEAKKAVQALEEPNKGLQSKDAGERLLTAALLLTRYRTPKGSSKTEPIDAEQSKLILKALAEADWAPNRDPQAVFTNPRNLFGRLGLTANDGWNQPRDFKEYEAAAKKWLTENADKYRIQRYVSEKAEK